MELRRRCKKGGPALPGPARPGPARLASVEARLRCRRAGGGGEGTAQGSVTARYCPTGRDEPGYRMLLRQLRAAWQEMLLAQDLRAAWQEMLLAQALHAAWLETLPLAPLHWHRLAREEKLQPEQHAAGWEGSLLQLQRHPPHWQRPQLLLEGVPLHCES